MRIDFQVDMLATDTCKFLMNPRYVGVQDHIQLRVGHSLSYDVMVGVVV